MSVHKKSGRRIGNLGGTAEVISFCPFQGTEAFFIFYVYLLSGRGVDQNL